TEDLGSKSAAALWFSSAEPPVEGKSIVLDGERSGPVANFAVMSEVAPSYAPPGRSLSAAACPGADGSDAALETDARRQLRGWFGGAVDGWDLLRTDRIPHGQPLAVPPFSPKKPVRLGDGRY